MHTRDTLAAPRPPLQTPPPAFYSVFVLRSVPTEPPGLGAGRGTSCRGFPAPLPGNRARPMSLATGHASCPPHTAQRSPPPGSPSLLGCQLRGGRRRPSSLTRPPRDPSAPAPHAQESQSHLAQHCGLPGHRSSCFYRHKRCRPGRQAALRGADSAGERPPPSTFCIWKSHPRKS